MIKCLASEAAAIEKGRHVTAQWLGKNSSSGFSVLEVLIAAGLLSVIIFGTLRILTVSLQSSNAVRASFAEQELRIVVNNVLTNENECRANFKPASGKLTGSHQQKGIGTIDELTKGVTVLLEKDQFFKNTLEIIKMELIGDSSQDPKVQETERTFVIYYNKKNMGKLNTLGGGPCTDTDTSGCYFIQCTINYRLENVASNPDVIACDTLNCVGGDNVSCYTVDLDDTRTILTDKPMFQRVEIDNAHNIGKGRALVGCGGTSEIRVSTNTALGFKAGANTQAASSPVNDSTGEMNVFIGYEAGRDNTTGTRNIAIGFQSAALNQTSSNNTFIGERAGFHTTTGDTNVFIGRRTGYNNTTGEANVFVGNRAGAGNEGGSQNTYLGRRAGYHSKDSSDNLFVGFEAGYTNNPAGSTARARTGGSRTIRTLYSEFPATEASNNTFVGYQSGWSNTTGKLNTFLGAQSGVHNTTGIANIFVGDYAGRSNTAGRTNIFLGRGAGLRSTIGNDNIFLGNRAGRENVGGHRNIHIGRRAGYLHTGGNGNIFLGYEVGTPTAGITSTGNNQLNIGNLIMGRLSSSSSATPAIPSASDTGVVIHGTLDVSKKLVIHSEGLEVSAGSNAFRVDGGGFHCSGTGCPPSGNHDHDSHNDSRYSQTGHLHDSRYARISHSHSGYSLVGHTHGTPSSRVYKKNIKVFENFGKAYEDIKKTPLFMYEYKEDHPNKQRVGFISEELPEHLQIRDKGSPSMPDMPSIYGTFWAAIKFLIIKFEDFTKNTLSGMKKIKEEVKNIKKDMSIEVVTIKMIMKKQINEMKAELLQRIADTEKNFSQQKMELKQVKEKLKENQKELQDTKVQLQKNQKELNDTQKRLKNMEVQVNHLLKLISESK